MPLTASTTPSTADLEFSWPVCRHGYKWKEHRGDALLFPKSAKARLEDFKFINPMRLQRPLLFEALGRLRPDGAAIVEFASRFGPLAQSEEGSTFQAWANAIKQFSLALVLYEGGPAMKECSREGSFFAGYSQGKWLPMAKMPPQASPAIVHAPVDSVGDPLEPAEAIAELLRGLLNGLLQDSITTELRIDQGRWISVRRPTDLRAAAALQLAEALIGERRIIRCAAPDCNQWMDITGQRADTTMHPACSRRWRMKRWRGRA